MLGFVNRVGSLATVLRPLTGALCGTAVSPRLFGWPDRTGSCPTVRVPLPWSPGTDSGGLLSGPAPDGLISVEVRAVAWKVYQPQVQAGHPEVLPQHLATMGRRIVPDHVEDVAATVILVGEKYAGLNHSRLTEVLVETGGYSPELSDGKPPSQPP